MRCVKANRTEPSYGTYQVTRQYSRLERENIFPYPFYFRGNPFSEEPQVDPRRAGWSPQIPLPRPGLTPDPYPDHCFQTPCNTTNTTTKPPPIPPFRAGAGTAPANRVPSPPLPPLPPVPGRSGASGSACTTSRCVNLYR